MAAGKRYIGICAVALLLGEALAGGKSVLLDPVYDFGVLRERDGNVADTARVVNVGSDTTYVRDVRPSCGCTGAEYVQDSLAPGDTTVVSFTYNPIGRPGTIRKTVKIYMGDADERHIVNLTGRVVGSPETLSRNYPVACGRIRLSDSIVDMGRISENSGRHSFVRIINGSTDTVSPRFENLNRALSVDITPEKLLPGDVGTLGIYMNTKFIDSLGYVAYAVPVWAEGDSVRVDVSVRGLITAEPDTVQSERVELR